MGFKKVIVICGMILILLTACVKEEDPVESKPQPQDGQDEQIIEVVSPDEEGIDSPDEKEDEEELVTEEETLPEKKFYMDAKTYRILPIDEEEDRRGVLLTFDDGPKSREMIDSIIDTLDKYDAKAIFFVNGYRVEANPDLLQLIDERGQTVGNHSWDHIDLSKEDRENVETQIQEVQSVVEQLTGQKPVFFRPPFGAGNDGVREIAKAEGLLYMTWSTGSLDWAAGYDQPEKVIEQVMTTLHSGSNVLMHELPWTTEALDELMQKMIDEEYFFIDPNLIDVEYAPATTE